MLAPARTAGKCGPRRHSVISLGRKQICSGVGETDGASCAPFQRAVHRPRIAHEVFAGPRISGEEFVRHRVALEPITWGTGRHEIADLVRATARQRYDMIECGTVRIQFGGAIHTPLSAVAQGVSPQRFLGRHMRRNVRSDPRIEPR